MCCSENLGIPLQWLKQETAQLKTTEKLCLLRRSTLRYTMLLWKLHFTKGLAIGFCLKYTLPHNILQRIKT